jgi:hypothetical protein
MSHDNIVDLDACAIFMLLNTFLCVRIRGNKLSFNPFTAEVAIM